MTTSTPINSENEFSKKRKHESVSKDISRALDRTPDQKRPRLTDSFADAFTTETQNKFTHKNGTASVVMDSFMSSSSEDEDCDTSMNESRKSSTPPANATSTPQSRLSVNSEIQKERQRIKELQSQTDQKNRHLHGVFSDLQRITQAFQLTIPSPELIILGMQSDGKSSFLEALAGFQFNLVASEIGTRRPLVVRMQNDPQQDVPLCNFYTDDLKSLESEPVPADKLPEELLRRTNEYCGEEKNRIRSRPMILCIRYKYAANLTVYDLPGFKKSQDDPNTEYIEEIAKKMCQPKNRIILCLEQSTVEFCNSQTRPIVKEFDPNFERTIFIQTKFDNRRKQFTSKKEVDKYLSAEEIGGGLNAFFISLPAGLDGRNLSPEEFQRALEQVYLDDYQNLLRLSYDSERFKHQIGFFNLRRYLEDMLIERYMQSIDPVKRKIDELVQKKQRVSDHLRRTIDSIEEQDFVDMLNRCVGQFVKHISKSLNGTSFFGPDNYGMNLEEEKQKSGLTDWPHYTLNMPIRNANFKLYGGAQIDRLLSEFSVVAHSQEFPETSDDEVAVCLGVHSVHTKPDFVLAISDLAQRKINTVFAPLIQVLIQRSRFIMKHLVRIVVHHMESVPNVNATSQSQHERSMLQFIKKTSDIFIDQVLNDVQQKTTDELRTFTEVIDWDLIDSDQRSAFDYDLLNPSHEDTLKRVQSVTQDIPSQFDNMNISRSLDSECCKKIKLVAAKLFGGVRQVFVRYIRAKYNTVFLSPMFFQMDQFLRKSYSNVTNDELKEVLGIRIGDYKLKLEKTDDQLRELKNQQNTFINLSSSIQNLARHEESNE